MRPQPNEVDMVNIPRSRIRVWLLAIVVTAVGGAASPAQQISWRSDYASARKAAAEQYRPILIDFGTENCFWCKKLDQTTLRDPAVATVVSGQFIALKADAERDQALTQALRISQFPTLVLASPDGKILGVLEGYQEPADLAAQLTKVGAAYISPEWMLRDFQEATKAVAAADYGRALVLLKSVTHDGKDRGVQVKARQVLADLEQQAAGRLARAKQLNDRGQDTAAAETLTELLRAYAGTQAAADGSTLLTTIARKPEMRDGVRSQRAREILAQARDDLRSKEYLACLERCETLVSAYADLPESTEGQQLASSIKDDPDRMAQACDTLTQRMGVMYLGLAESWIKKGELREAQVCLEKVLHVAPGSRQAEQAQLHLVKLKRESTTMPADFKKP
jgi:thioredoxin-related protein